MNFPIPRKNMHSALPPSSIGGLLPVDGNWLIVLIGYASLIGMIWAF
jgi:hypothetical protein